MKDSYLLFPFAVLLIIAKKFDVKFHIATVTTETAHNKMTLFCNIWYVLPLLGSDNGCNCT
jgi:hypothetical protein